MTRRSVLRLGALVVASLGPLAFTESSAKTRTARVVFDRALMPEPGYASDAALAPQGLVVSDRMDSALRLYATNGGEVSRYVRAGSRNGGLVGHVRIAVDEEGVHAWSNRGALLRLGLPTLDLRTEHETWMASPAGRFFRIGGEFFLVGIGWSKPAVTHGLEYFWSETDPPASQGESRRVLRELPFDSRLVANAPLLALRSLASPIPGGGFWVVGFDRYEVARVDARGQLVSEFELTPPPSYRPRTGRADFDPRDRDAFRAWCAEATMLWGIAALGADRFAILRADVDPAWRSARWHADVYDDRGKSVALDIALPTDAAMAIVLGGTSAGELELLEIDKPLMEPGARHRWVRHALLAR